MNRAIDTLKSTILEKDALIAEREAQEFRLRELQVELPHVSRLSAMGQMTAAIAEPGFVEVTVRDTGCGVPPCVSERLFQPFNTSKNGGMGLGLMICQTLVEANGGRIWRVNDTPTGSALNAAVSVASPVSQDLMTRARAGM